MTRWDAIVADHGPLCDRLTYPYFGEPPAAYLSDGCTHAPDSIGPLAFLPACAIHDWEYHALTWSSTFAGPGRFGGTEADRAAADLRLCHNLVRSGAPWPVAVAFFKAVRVAGIGSYAYAPDAKPGRLGRVWIWIVSILVAPPKEVPA